VRAVKVLVALLAGAAKKTVKVGDNYFLPAKLTVKRGTTVTWRWRASRAPGTSTTSRSRGARRA
jgi:plastocyanin